MPDVAFDSQRHAQVRGEISSGGELTSSAESARFLAEAQCAGLWTTESAAQHMGESANKVYSDKSIEQITSDIPPCSGRYRR